MSTLLIQGQRLEVRRLPSAQARPDRAAIVFLHEGLGSVAMWRDFPQQVADATGCEAIVYSRLGYGQSDPLHAPRTPRYMHDEALITLPALIKALDLERPLLCGHSDGGSIALIHAGAYAPQIRGTIVMAPHVFVEDVCLRSIAAAGVAYRDSSTRLRERLAKFHAHVDSAFCGWHDIWLHPNFRTWNIESCLPNISHPVLALQGLDDEYGTLEQLHHIATQAPNVEQLKLPNCRHSAHKDQPTVVLQAMRSFVERVLDESP